jgi:predicted DCC family thiol-disulfide oxidoreductase YuxK
MATSGPILFFDGVCGLCDRLVQFVLRRDRHARFRFAALQSDVATATLARFGKNAADLDTVYLLTDDDRLLAKSRAIFFVLRTLGLPWSLVAVFAVLPTALTDWFYDRVAHNRYRIWGKRDSCRLPSADERARFLG